MANRESPALALPNPGSLILVPSGNIPIDFSFFNNSIAVSNDSLCSFPTCTGNTPTTPKKRT